MGREAAGDLGDDVIARAMAEGVIHLLEPVDIGNQNGEGTSVMGGLDGHFAHAAHGIAAVVEACERICHGKAEIVAQEGSPVRGYAAACDHARQAQSHLGRGGRGGHRLVGAKIIGHGGSGRARGQDGDARMAAGTGGAQFRQEPQARFGLGFCGIDEIGIRLEPVAIWGGTERFLAIGEVQTMRQAGGKRLAQALPHAGREAGDGNQARPVEGWRRFLEGKLGRAIIACGIAPAQEVADPRHQECIIEGFREHVIRPCREGGGAGGGGGGSGMDDDRQIAGGGLATQAAQHGEAVHVGQLQVEQDDIGPFLAHGAQGAATVSREKGFVKRTGQPHLEKDAIGRHVINDKDFPGHVLPDLFLPEAGPDCGSETLTNSLTISFRSMFNAGDHGHATGAGEIRMKSEAAELLGLQALAWLAGQDDLFATFLGSTGATAEQVAEAAGNPAFLGAVLDFLLMDDAWIIAFCDTAGLAYAMPMQARAVLPGGQAMHWT